MPRRTDDTDADRGARRIANSGAPADAAAPGPDPGYDDAMRELPPNVPPGMLGERGLNLYKEESDGPHGLNAGLLQEGSPEITWLAVILAYLLFFPVAYVIVWRTKWFTTRRKWVLTGIMTAGIAVVAYLFATGVLYFA